MKINSALGIIGYPIGHSVSPRFQQAGLDHISMGHRYLPYEVHPDQVADFVASLRSDGVRGINVTVPHKETVMPFLDEIDEWAAEAGAVNTIVNREGRLTGYNTDGYGFLRALRESAGLDPTGKRVFDPGSRRVRAWRGAGAAAGRCCRTRHCEPNAGARPGSSRPCRESRRAGESDRVERPGIGRASLMQPT